MATKTWKLGEYSLGGIITVKTTPNTITIIGKEWDMSQGTRKGSNQSKAKEFTRERFVLGRDVLNWGYAVECDVSSFLCYLTTSYYADQILTWIKSEVKF